MGWMDWYDLWHHRSVQGKIPTSIMQLRLQVKLYWRHSAAGQFVQFENTQFNVGEKQDLHCRFGEHYFSKTSPAETPSSSCTMAQSSSTTQLSPDGDTPMQYPYSAASNAWWRDTPCSSTNQQHPRPDRETPQCDSKAQRNRPKLKLQGTGKSRLSCWDTKYAYFLYRTYMWNW